MASASNRIGETNDIPAPKPGRGVMSLTHARLEYPRESRFPDLPRLRHVHRCLCRGHRQGLQPGSAAPVGGAAHRDNLRRDRGHHPLVGWLLGQAASQFVADWDHWIAFVLLVLLGLHMIHNGLRADHATEQEKPGQHSFWILAVTALATSIDALAVGVGLAFVDVNIFLAAGAIGLATMTMVTLGTMLGRALGAVTGKRAEMVGGVVLILVGATILYEHLSAA